jgi:hypothetical protein
LAYASKKKKEKKKRNILVNLIFRKQQKAIFYMYNILLEAFFPDISEEKK